MFARVSVASSDASHKALSSASINLANLFWTRPPGFWPRRRNARLGMLKFYFLRVTRRIVPFTLPNSPGSTRYSISITVSWLKASRSRSSMPAWAN